MTHAGKTVLVTGAGGSIGSEICRQVAAQKPARLLAFDNSEIALYNIDRELTVTPILGDVSSYVDVQEIFCARNVDVVYHVAAYKHVTMVQKNPRVAERVNVRGTRLVASLARRYQVPSMVLVSTDKAVEPTCVMGETKRLAEDIVRAIGYTVVRFGNVTNSSGSVLPLFEEQLRAGGPLTVTHPSVTRYFMSIKQAAGLAITASAFPPGTYVLDMGEPVKIDDLARAMVAGTDIKIKYIGLRPGEKMHEKLFRGFTRRTDHPGILEDIA
jgi:FlaA1/EpsC-like NDP-sugar epimerase